LNVSDVNLANLDKLVLRHVSGVVNACAGKHGILQVRYYKVLDQFGDLWECDGTIDEVITPLTSLKTKATTVVVGGGKVEQGLAVPDKLYQCRKDPDTFKFKQQLSVSGCMVGERQLEITGSSVTVMPDI